MTTRAPNTSTPLQARSQPPPRSTRRARRRAPFLLLLAFAACAALSSPPAPLLRVATSGDYAPFSSVDTSGQRSGLDVDIAIRLAADLGYQIRWVPVRWPDLAAMLASGGCDIALGGITMRPDRALLAEATRPYARTGVVLVLRGDDPARTFAEIDAATRRIGVNAGGHLESWSRRHFRHARLAAVRDNQTLPQRLSDHTFDAIVSDTAEAPRWRRPGWRLLGPFSADYKTIYVPGGAALAARIDAWLAQREADGWLAARRRSWLDDAQAASAAAATRQAVVAWIALRLGTMPAVAASKRAAGLAIEDLAQERRVLERVAARAPQSENATAVYAELIAAAKVIQRRTAERGSAVPLAPLRASIARIDRHLLGELRRAPRTAAATWRALLTPALEGLPLDAADVARIAAALGSPDG